MKIEYLLGINSIYTIKKCIECENVNTNYYDYGVIIISDDKIDQLLYFNCVSVQELCYLILRFIKNVDIKSMISDHENYKINIFIEDGIVTMHEIWNQQNNNVLFCVSRKELEETIIKIYENINSELLNAVPGLITHTDYIFHVEYLNSYIR